MVQEMDEAVDRVLRKLDDLKLADRTIVLFASDNGGLSTAEGSPTSNLPLRAGKGWNYEGGLRVPLIVRWPGRVAAGSLSEEPVITNDFYPTVLELAGVAVPKDQAVDARSFVRTLEGKGPLPGRPLFWHYPHYSNQGGRPGGAVLEGKYKLLEFFEDDRVELYDLQADPGEEKDLAAADPERAGDLRKKLAQWRQSVGAQMPTPNPEPVEPFGPRGLPPPSPEK
jgi:arylsulfatase A-like enzyme